jgi:nucleotidyltransferase/DNA polymerase involved in DNA repair
MRKYGIETGLDLKSKSLAFLQEHFGKSGPYFYGIARGIDERQVRPDRIRKSVGAEDTFVDDIADLVLATAELKPLAEKVWRYCKGQGISGKDCHRENQIFGFHPGGIERLLTRADMPAGHGSLPTQLHRLEDAIKEIEREFSADDRDHTSLELEGNLPDLSTERRQRRSRAKNST